MRGVRAKSLESRFIGPYLALVVVATSAQTPPPAVSVTLVYDSPAYAFAPTCDVTQPLVKLSVLATNHGAAASAFAVTAIDQRGTLGGGSAVPAVPPGVTVPVSISLRRIGDAVPSSLAGTHVIAVSVRTLGARPIELQLPFPATLCPATGVVSSREPHHPSPSAPPGAGTISDKPVTRDVVLQPAAPTNLRSVASGTDCGTHLGPLGALVCPDMMRSGNLLLIWDWQPGGGLATIDGYRIYRVGRGAGTKREADLLVATQTNVPQTLFDLPKPRGGSYDGICYAITTYAGSKESPRSPAFCAGAASAATTVRLVPVYQRHSLRQRTKTSYGIADSNQADLYVGFTYAETKRLDGDTFSNAFYRGAVAFDVSRLLNRRLVSAQLRLGLLSSDGAGAQHSCTTDIGTGVGSWWQNTDWIDGQFAPSIAPTDTGPQVSADVSPIVAAWMGGRPNFGFVLKNADENLGAFTNKACLTKYTAPVLEVVYY